MIREVAILWSENPQIPTRTFPTLWEADAAIAAVLVREPMSRARDKTGYLVTWTDGATHEGKLEASRADLADAAPMGGLLRRHLNDTAWWLRSQRFRDMFAAHRAPAEIARDQAWGRELLYRLASDKVDTVDVKAPRNRARRGGA